MLIQFRFRNFTSFRDETVFSMVASKDASLLDYNTSPIETLRKQRLLRSSVIYGANAAGKSNLVKALAFVKKLVRRSADQSPGNPIKVQPFLLSESTATAPSEFELSFIVDGVRYQYGFSVDHQRVHEERLTAYPKGLPQKWFERTPATDSNESEWYFGPFLKGERERLASLTRSDVLFLSLAARLNHKQLSEVYQWFAARLRILDANSVVPHYLYTADRASKNEQFRNRIRHLLNIADFGITDISIERSEVSPDELPEDMPEELRNLIVSGAIRSVDSFNVRVRHQAKDLLGAYTSLQFEDESNGTQRYFALSGPWIDSLQEGYTLVVDELDASLHPHLVRALISMFHNPDLNLGNAQLIFNTHDTTLLDTSLFRRDQIWFVEKDNSGASHLYSLLEYSPRKDEALAKGYLQGRYGAVPILGDPVWLMGDGQNGQE